MSSASRKLIQASGAVAGAADTGDDDFANVVLLLDGDGTSGDDNNTFTDSSTNAHTITENGSVVQGSFSPYGDNWSNYFDGSGDYLNAGTDGSLALGNGDFTFEFWIHPPSATDSNYAGIYSNTSESLNDNNGLRISNYQTDATRLVLQTAASAVATTATGTVNVGQWNHVAVVRNGSGSNNITIYVNGVSSAQGTSTANFSSAYAYVGTNVYSGTHYSYNGYISNLRVVPGTAVYTSAFTPPTTPLTAVSGTSLLTCQSNRFADESTNNHTVTVNGTPKVTPFSPFKNDDARDITTDGGSVYFDGGSGDVLVVATDTTLDITGDFTIECWYYNRNTGLYATLFGSSSGSAGSETKIMFDLGTGEINFQYQGGNIGATGGKNSEWNHIAVTRSGSTTRLFLNGNLEAHTNSSYTFTTGQKWVVGNRPPNAPSLNYPFTGFVSDARCIKGTALYISNFTPPTSPLTAITNTSLLLNFQDAGIYDRTGLNNIDTVGNAQIDTAVKKYGTGSLEFDGTGDYLSIVPSPNLDFGTGDFTIEGWFYKSATTTTQTIVSSGSYYTSGANGNWVLRITSATQIAFASYDGQSNEEYVEFSAATSLNTWHHFALVREGTGTNQTKFYLDGTLAGSMTVSKSLSDGSVNGIYIGSDGAGPNADFNGYIDDLRITKGVARYTSNFTPPSEALPKF